LSSAALALALGAAILHAVWNLLLAGSRDVLAATAVALCSSLVIALPFAVATWGVERAAVPWLLASGALELVYFLTLTPPTSARSSRSSTRSHVAAPLCSSCSARS
jgi:hypothetical protein